ncbi:MAG TPA: AsmA family protein [Terriglobia bacterium]|nr:AsmA family protein [Terriglobia bacterium]
MSKHWKIALIVAGALIAVLIVFSLLVDADQFRPMLQTEMSHALGRDVKIGKLSLSIFRGQVQADEVLIADDPAFSRTPFVSAKGLRISVQLIPLISQKKLLVDAFQLVGPQVTLIQGQDCDGTSLPWVVHPSLQMRRGLRLSLEQTWTLASNGWN